MAIEDLIIKAKLDDEVTAPLKKIAEKVIEANKKLRQKNEELVSGVKKVKESQKALRNEGRRLAKEQKGITKLMSGGAQELVNNSIRTQKMAKELNSFGAIMGASNEKMQKFVKGGGGVEDLSKRSARLAFRIRKLTVGFRGFRAELLSVLFFGMGLQRFFTGLLRPALELTGIFDLMKIALQLLFLPIALVLLDFLIPFVEMILNLSDGTKLLIGKFVLIGVVLGVFLFVLATVLLGVGGLILVFGGLFTIIDKLIPDIRIMGVNMSSFIEAGIGISLVSTAFDFLRSIIDRVLGTLLGFSFVKQLMEKLGIQIDKSKTPWENLKDIVKTALSKIRAQIGLTGGTAEGGFTWLEKKIELVKRIVRLTFKLWEKRMEELGLKDFTKSINDMVIAIKQITPPLEIFAAVLEGIAKSIKTIGPFVKALVIPGSRFGSDETSFNKFFDPGRGAVVTSSLDINISGNLGAAPGTAIDEEGLIQRIFDAVVARLNSLDRGRQVG